MTRVAVTCVLALALTGAALAQDLPAPLAARFRDGVEAIARKDLDQAERAFRDVLAAGGTRAFVHHNLGIVLQLRGRQADALDAFRQAIRLDATFGPARLLAGSALLALNRPEEAAVELRRALVLMPDEPAVHLQLADACERLGDVRCVADRYRRLTTLAPGHDEYAYRLGKAYLRLAQWSFARMAEVDPRTARRPQALGEQYLAQGQPDLALQALTEAAALDPRLPGIHLALARLHADARRWDDALRAVDRELALAPESVEARQLRDRLASERARQR